MDKSYPEGGSTEYTVEDSGKAVPPARHPGPAIGYFKRKASYWLHQSGRVIQTAGEPSRKPSSATASAISL